LTSLSRQSKAKLKSPCNLEESPYVAARVFSPLVIYENAMSENQLKPQFFLKEVFRLVLIFVVV
jgi:hypothetical protein